MIARHANAPTTTGGRLGRKGLRFLTVLTFLAANLTFVPAVLAAQPAGDLYQCRNGTAADPNDCVDLGGSSGWVTGNVGAQQGHLNEGESIPYRYVMTDMPTDGTQITLVLEYDIKHSGRHAIDYLTHYDRIGEVVDPTSGIDGLSGTETTYPIPAPSSDGSPVSGQPTTSFNQLVAAEGTDAAVFTLWGGTITDVQYVEEGDLTAAQSSTSIAVTFTLDSETAVLAWGGHIGSRLDWGFDAGVPRSAGGISGSPYHMRSISWNLNNLGNEDRSLSAQAVFAPPSVTVEKTANPLSLPEPGGNFTFTVVVSNTSGQAVEITSLVDDIYGTLAGDADCMVGTSLPAITGSCTFSFVGAFSGDAGDSQTDTVTVIVEDALSVTATDSDDATVTITDVAPTLTVDKTANPTSVAEPGGDVTFTVVVTNLSNEPVTITSLADDIHGTLAGDADCMVGTVLAASGDAGDSCTFDFTEAVNGDAGDSETDTVQACVNDGDSAVDVCDDDPATVTITDVAPTLTVDKTAGVASVEAPGANVTFTVTVTNTSNEPVTITSIEDDVFGTLAGDADCMVGTVLAASGDAGDSCTFDFTEFVGGSPGTTHTNTVTVCVNDGDSAVDVCDDDPEDVPITEPPGGNLFHTGTTCDQFLGNDPPSGLAGVEINQVNYSVKGGKISQLDPGVFFYFTEITATGTSLVATIEQTPPAGMDPFAIQNASNVRVFDSDCNAYSNFSISSLANGDVTVTINGTTAGDSYVISVKYETSSLKGDTPPLTDPSAPWNWATIVGGLTVDSDPDGIVLKRK